MALRWTAGTDALDIGVDEALAALHGFAGRRGGVSGGPYASLNLGPRSGDEPAEVRRNRNRLLDALGLSGRRLVAPRQTHSAEVAVLRRGEAPPAGGVTEGDGIVTDDRSLALMLLAADCAAVLLEDHERGVIAAAHAGWRGAAGGIAAVTVQRMVESFGCRPTDLRAVIGPAIGRCCYEVGPEVVAAVDRATPGGAAAVVEWQGHGKARLDLAGVSVAQLLGAGLAPDRVTNAALCTACHVDRFYSHRRTGEPTGRNGAAIALP